MTRHHGVRRIRRDVIVPRFFAHTEGVGTFPRMADEAQTTTSSNRRNTDRAIACYPAQISAGDSSALALIRDISVTGALLFVRSEQQVGSTVALELFILPDPNEALRVSGRVVRSTLRSPRDRGVWNYAAAIEFSEPLHHASETIQALAKTLPPVEVGTE